MVYKYIYIYIYIYIYTYICKDNKKRTSRYHYHRKHLGVCTKQGVQDLVLIDRSQGRDVITYQNKKSETQFLPLEPKLNVSKVSLIKTNY